MQQQARQHRSSGELPPQSTAQSRVSSRQKYPTIDKLNEQLATSARLKAITNTHGLQERRLFYNVADRWLKDIESAVSLFKKELQTLKKVDNDINMYQQKIEYTEQQLADMKKLSNASGPPVPPLPS